MTKRARNLRRELSDAERKLWHSLRAHRLAGLSFRRQAPCGPFVADFLCVDARLIVEVDGATHSSEEQIAYDRRRDQWFAANGYRVLRVANEDVYRNLGGVCETILAWIEGRAWQPEIRERPLPNPPPRFAQERGQTQRFIQFRHSRHERQWRCGPPPFRNSTGAWAPLPKILSSSPQTAHILLRTACGARS
ncbi:endonuclease domain-containing protein [Methylocystis parvus]|uniref:endonuclease domain-containing protein n=1 Tax=Methylocystis parvus TaxID=134 RepID=UPI003C772625